MSGLVVGVATAALMLSILLIEHAHDRHQKQGARHGDHQVRDAKRGCTRDCGEPLATHGTVKTHRTANAGEEDGADVKADGKPGDTARIESPELNRKREQEHGQDLGDHGALIRAEFHSPASSHAADSLSGESDGGTR